MNYSIGYSPTKTNTGIKYLIELKALINYSQIIGDVHENVEGYNPINKKKLLTVFDDMIADTKCNRKLNAVVAELFIRG